MDDLFFWAVIAGVIIVAVLFGMAANDNYSERDLALLAGSFEDE